MNRNISLPISGSPQPRRHRAAAIVGRDDDSDRLCAGIPEDQCTSLPRNARLSVINGAASKLAEQLGGAKLLLPWMMGILGAPPVFVGLLVPVRQAATLLPQLAVSGRIREFPVRKWFWVGSAIVQMAALTLMAVAFWQLPPTGAAATILGLLLIFGAARGVGSIAFQDVVGKTLPKGRRGRVLAARSAIGGLLTLGAGVALHRLAPEDGSRTAVLPLVGLSVLLWGVAALAMAATVEHRGATAGARSPWKEALHGWRLFRTQAWFSRYLAVRVLLLSVEIAVPYYVLFAQRRFGASAALLGTLVVAGGMAQVLSSPFWGRLADLASHKVMVLSGLMAASAGVAALVLARISMDPLWFGLVVVLLGVAESGVLLGRKTYLIDRTDPEERSTCVAFANSFVGVAALLTGCLGWVVDRWGVEWGLGWLALAAAAGGLAALRLSETPIRDNGVGGRTAVGHGTTPSGRFRMPPSTEATPEGHCTFSQTDGGPGLSKTQKVNP